MARQLILKPSPPPEPAATPAKLLSCQDTPKRKCFGMPSMRARKCSVCRNFDLCYYEFLQTRKQGTIKLI